MTEYTHPVRDLQGALKRSYQALYALSTLLALAMIAIPWAMSQAPVLVLDQGEYFRTARSQPWALTQSRKEGFSKLYLSQRWEWDSGNVQVKQAGLREILSPQVMEKLNDSFKSFEALSKAQGAKSYYAFESWGFSNESHFIEVRFTRLIRIKHAAIATPLVVRMKTQEVAVSDANPYGLKIVSLEESEVQEGAGA